MSTGASSTQPKEPHSIAARPELTLRFVYPRELTGCVVPLKNGIELGREIPADPPSGAFGVVPHATVSRRHASIRHGFGVPMLSDLGSSNGTRVNGEDALGATPLPQQSVVRLGDAIGVVDHPSAPGRTDDLLSLPGESPLIARLRDAVPRAAREPSSVMILGETGTGKELLAREIHRLSGRPGPYVALNCAELSPQLVESQLFGHERGAFTGASGPQAGLFVAADGGTLFLDEVGEIPLDLQAKLLRVLQEGEVRPVGSVRARSVDVRVVCATNQDLPLQVEEGAFRRDLYARLAFFELRLPPLRERKQDILGWVDTFVDRWNAERAQAATLALQPAVAERILLHPWPDNLRGLDRLVRRLLTMNSGEVVGVRALGEAMPDLVQRTEPARAANGTEASDPGRPGPSERPTREEFLAVYEATGRSVRATSKHFGRDRRQVYRWLESFGIER